MSTSQLQVAANARVHTDSHALRVDATEQVDVCVLGGGPAGVSAASAAARMGKSVLLVERNGFFGGALTAVTLGSICGLYRTDGDSHRKLVGGFIDRLISHLRALGSNHQPERWLKAVTLPYDAFAMRVALDQMLIEDGVRPMLHTALIDVEAESGIVSSVIVHTGSNAIRVRASLFIDCTGDAELLAKAGGSFEIDLANLQFPTAMFRIGGVDHAAAASIGRADLHQFLERAVASGIDLPRTAGGIFLDRTDHAHLNITKISRADGSPPNPLDWQDLSDAEIEGRRQIGRYAEAFRTAVPGYGNSYVLDAGSVVGVRESRRIVGQYQLTAEDVLSGRKFEDGIALCSWPMEEHGRGRSTKWVWLEDGVHFEIPYRCLVPKQLSNVLVAGRCISTTHDAQASIRVTAQCFATGEAAGTAAGISLSSGLAPNAISTQQLRARLRASGALPDLIENSNEAS